MQTWVQISWKTPFHSLALNGITLCIPFGQLLPQNLPVSHSFFVVKVILQVLLTRHSCEMSTVVALNLGETPCCSNVYAEGGEIGASQKCRGEHVVGLTEMFARLVI